MSNVIAGELRPEDVVGRWGGEEFLVLLPWASLPQAASVGERIRATVQQQTGVTVSIGVATGPPGRLDQTLAAADRRVYAAKAAGRNCVCAADEVAEQGQTHYVPSFDEAVDVISVRRP